MIPADILADGQKLLAGASPLPWAVHQNIDVDGACVYVDDGTATDDDPGQVVIAETQQDTTDAELIAWCGNHLYDLLATAAEALTLREEHETLKADKCFTCGMPHGHRVLNAVPAACEKCGGTRYQFAEGMAVGNAKRELQISTLRAQVQTLTADLASKGGKA